MSPGVFNWIWLLLKLYWQTWSPREFQRRLPHGIVFSRSISPPLLNCGFSFHRVLSSITTTAVTTQIIKISAISTMLHDPTVTHTQETCSGLLWQTIRNTVPWRAVASTFTYWSQYIIIIWCVLQNSREFRVEPPARIVCVGGGKVLLVIFFSISG